MKEELCDYILVEKYHQYVAPNKLKSLKDVVMQKTPGLGYAALDYILLEAVNLACERADEEDSPLLLCEPDILSAIEVYNRQRRKDVAGRVEVPKVAWSDVGGLQEAKRELVNAIQLPLKYPHLMSSGVKRSGTVSLSTKPLYC